ncbi:MAG: HutD/Ves family protein [Steroidobacteraceae bacterium]
MLRIIRSADYPARPWKNGGGTTRDIVVSPPGASLDDFDWRLSLAHVDRDGPFSRFDAVDRTLVLLSGAMTLHERDRRIDLVRNEPLAFAGERAIEARVGSGATLDFNVMSRRGRARHSVRRESFSAGANIEAPVGSTIILFALERGLMVEGEQLDVHDTAIVTVQHAVVAGAHGAVTALVVEIVDIHPNVL